MKKQLFAFTLLTLGFAATGEAKHHNKYTTVQPNGGTTVVKSKKQPQVPAGVTVTKISKNKWRVTNNSGQAVQVRRNK